MIPFVEAVQRRVAQVAVGAGHQWRGRAGVLDNARNFLAGLTLRQFAESNEKTFASLLDEATENLLKCFPKDDKPWGLARKYANIFLRDAFYNAYLLKEFSLAKAEQWYEVPLDKPGLEELRKKAGRGMLPMCRALKDLSPRDNEKYQEFAVTLMKQNGLSARVHLDLYLWRKGDLEDC